MVEFGESGNRQRCIARSYGGRWIWENGFNGHEDVGADRTERFGIVLIGSL